MSSPATPTVAAAAAAREPRVKPKGGGGPGLASLPPDVLVSVLCRCPASDHPSLWSTCRAARSALDSASYRSERAATGWAEVGTRLTPGEELYDADHPNGTDVTDDEKEKGDNDEDGDSETRAAKRQRLEEKMRARRRKDIDEYYTELGYFDKSYGYHDTVHEVFVDGAKAGRIDMVLIPRDGFQSMFHEAADAHSRELQEVGWTICDAQGRPRVKSIKDADADGGAAAGGYLHVKSVKIDAAYRPKDCTEVVARAVRSAVSSPELQGRWTLATAMSDARAYMTKQEEEARREIFRRSTPPENGDDDVSEERKRIDARWEECALLDARTFLRVGYRQIPEVVGAEKNKPVWLFALPQYLRDPVLSFAEVVNFKLQVPPELPPKPRGADDELLQLVIKSGNSVRRILDSLSTEERKLVETRRSNQLLLEEKEQEIASLRLVYEGERPVQVTANNWERSRAGLKETEDLIEDMRTKIKELSEQRQEELLKQRREIEGMIKQSRSEVNALVKGRGASVRKSFAIHCSSRLRIPEYVDLLLDLVPQQERSLAILDRDFTGSTPLHCALIGIPELHDAEGYYDMAAHLLNLGADTNARDPFGRSPLGQYRKVMSSRFEFANAFDINRDDDNPNMWQPFQMKMEELLRPSRGETDADREARPSMLNDGMGWFMEDEDDEEDDDIGDDDDVDDMDDDDDDDGMDDDDDGNLEDSDENTNNDEDDINDEAAS